MAYHCQIPLHACSFGMTFSEFLDRSSQLAAQQYWPVQVVSYEDQPGTRYAAIWIYNGTTSSYAGIWSTFASRDRHARHNLPIGEYQGVFDSYQASGYRIAHFNAHRVDSTTNVAGIWVKEDGYDPSARHSMTDCELENELERRAFNDDRPVCITGYLDAGGTRYAGIWVKNSRSFVIQGRAGAGLEGFDDGVKAQMLASGITAASLAVANKGNLVLARGFANITAEEDPVSPTSLFRVASVSKAITGTAIIKLIEQGKLNYNDKLLDLLGWQGEVQNDLLRSVTVDHLLHHLGGWDPSLEPTYDDLQISADLNVRLPITQESIFRWTTTTQNLVTPGTTYAYSNYGFMLLGMIIERVTGQEYEDFVSQNLLVPLGIRRPRCARTEFSRRLPGEVTYHSPRAHLCEDVMEKNAPHDTMEMYGKYNFVNMAPHGSWIASAVDLVKFASAFDDPEKCPILQPASVQALLGRTLPNAPNVTCGWFIKPGSLTENYKTGDFHGTSALIYHRSDGINVAVIFNRHSSDPLVLPCDADPMTDSDKQPVPEWNLLTLVRSWIDSVKSWPSLNAWSDFF